MSKIELIICRGRKAGNQIILFEKNSLVIGDFRFQPGIYAWNMSMPGGGELQVGVHDIFRKAETIYSEEETLLITSLLEKKKAAAASN